MINETLPQITYGMPQIFPPSEPTPVPWFGDKVWAIQGISFNNNGATYDSIAVVYRDDESGAYKEYNLYFGYELVVAKLYYGETAWIDESYRTITLDKPAIGSFFTWLQANAVKQ